MIELNSVEEWKGILDRSDNQPFWLLKHSTACMISARAYRQVEGYMKIRKSKEMDMYVVKVIEERQTSNQIETDMNVKHASPQLLLIRNKEVLWETSHWNITKKRMKKVYEDMLMD
ncbi:bacillithiol system redox-active protein YtxJ [Bacillus sp. FJAT-49732]|uniref:Bacillithiol system redox-active protein YtxJ n=1 Tax=Lederbergia citrisecunda TaxID=2833583 RepID=A0A942YPC7_9BACI|nr:bacillithiol system redox-active protein YtxJ [Lederbergia citrisecunda]MBS4201171.1 bacillithiol system redox-active protein YtxJ [Lederbergia citrisecunda]